MIHKFIAAVAIFVLPLAASANYVGSEVQYFNPTPESMDFFTVHSSRTLPQGTMKMTLFFDYAENIHYSSPALENKVFQGHLGFGMGLTEKLSFSVVGSGIFNYDEESGPAYTTDNFTHVRTGVKYRFCNCDSGGMALVANLGFGLMDPDYFVGNDNDFGASISFVYDKVLTDRVRFSGNLGYRYRNSGDLVVSAPLEYQTPDTRDGSDVIASAGLNFLLSQKWTGVTELYMTLPTDQFFDFTVDSGSYDQKGAEVLLGANYNLSDRMDLGFGGTLGLFSQAQNADWRIFAGLGYAFGGAAEDAAFNLAGNGSAPAPVSKASDSDEEDSLSKNENVAVEDAPVVKEFNIQVKFPSGAATLDSTAKSQLKDAGEYLKNNPGYRMVFIEGHTDSQGQEDFNKLLSERRAQMVKVFLTREYDLPLDKLKSIGFGETAPIADNSTAAGRAKNRRVVIKIK